jgi:pimeloyl-ACP methyl ester carboxylesterase
MDQTVWALQSRAFAYRGRNALALDLPGHGASAGPPLDSIAALAAWLDWLLAALALPHAALVGHSMGALVCLVQAARRPKRTERLVLLGAAARMPVHPDLLAAAADDRARADALIAAWGHGRAGHVGGNPLPGGWRLGLALQVLAKAAPGVLRDDLAACAAYDGDDGERVRCPTLVLCGSEDRMTPARKGGELAALIPGAETRTLPSGHMLMTEAPEATLDALLGFLPG